MGIRSITLAVCISACTVTDPQPSPPPPPPPPPPQPVIDVVTSTINAGVATVGSYTVTIDGSRTVTVPLDGATAVDGLAPGSHAFALGGLSAGCSTNPAPVQQTVGSIARDTVSFVVVCQTGAANGDRILFSAFPGTNWEVYTMAPDGSDMVNITKNPAGTDLEPRWSPDGSQVAYVSGRPGDGIDVYIMSADGSTERRMTNTTWEKSGVTWSPDGTRLVFGETAVQEGVQAGKRLWAMQADGTGRVQLTQGLAGSETHEHPDWSPDGSLLVLTAGTATPVVTGISVMNPDGTGVRRVVDRPGVNRYPTWSPDGRKIAFEGHQFAGSEGKDIFIVNPDGSGLVNLTRGGGDNREPSWSPDGTMILFGSTRGGTGSLEFDIYLMDADGRNVRRLTTLPSRERFPHWRRPQ